METGTFAETIARVNAAIEMRPYDAGAYDDLLSLYKAEIDACEAPADGLSEEAMEDRAIASRQWHESNSALRDRIVDVTGELVRAGRYRETERFNILYRRSLLMDAKVDFDAYMLYIESDREPQRRFWLPRRGTLLPEARDLERLMGGELRTLGISLPPGTGKLLADDVPVMTADGWKRHGELVVGDRVVGLDGRYKRVLHVFPKDVADHEVEFTNGEKIQCHGNHEWVVYNRHKQREEVLTTAEIAATEMESGVPGTRGHRYHYMIPMREPMAGEERELPVRPYLFGAWLGDGTSNKPAVTLDNGDTVILAEFMKEYPLTHIYNQDGCKRYEFGRLRFDLEKMGLCFNVARKEKYIPEEYLTASIGQRLELLAGLIDTDGTKNREGCYTYTTTNERLRDGVCALVSTFGWRYSLTRYEPSEGGIGIVGRKPCYCIKFHPDIYIPCRVRRKQLRESAQRRRIAIRGIRRIEPVSGNCIQVEGGMYCAGRTMVPTHNSTLAIFFLTWIGGRWPDEYSVVFSHDGDILKGMYGEVLRIIAPDGEYLWRDVFPDVPLVSTNAKDMRIDLGHGSRFETVQFASVGSDNAGKVRASKLIYCDDLVGSIEQAMSKERLDKLWTQYTTDIQQRGTGDYRELHIATRWSVWDVIGRLERQEMDAPTGRAKFIAVPALNEKDESNFDYPGIANKFTTERYRLLRESMDDVNWRALYMNQPIEREGQLYNEEELRRFFELPQGEPDAVIAVCDTKAKGSDYCVLPVAVRYGEDYYITEVVCDNGDTGIVEERLALTLVAHRVQLAQFESNSAGWSIAEKVQKRVHELGGRCSISTKPTTQNKETKIIVNAPYVKEHFLFREKGMYRRNDDYGKFMEMLTTYTMTGRNLHDDPCDSVAMLALYAQSFEAVKVVAFQRPY